MKTLFCCGAATQTGQGQSGLWRWWFYYRPRAALFGATHFAVNNDGNTNMPNEGFVALHDGSLVIPALSADQLNFIFWPTSMGRGGLYYSPGFQRTVSTLARVAMEQDFDKLIFVEFDFWVTSEDMMREIARTEKGLIAYWCPYYQFPECNIMVCCREQLPALKGAADRLLKLEEEKSTINDLAEFVYPWTEVRKHRVGDRYPEKSRPLPLDVEYCAQLPTTHVIHRGQVSRIAWSLCKTCGMPIDFNTQGVLACRKCQPEHFHD